MVNKNVAQKAVVAALSGMMALAPAAAFAEYKISLGMTPWEIRTLVKNSDGNWKRLAGEDRYATNVVANDYAYSEKVTLYGTRAVDYYAYDLVDTAIVTSGENFADALAASGLSGAESSVSFDDGVYWYDYADGDVLDSDAILSARMTDPVKIKWADGTQGTYDVLPAPIVLTKQDKLSDSAKDLLDDLGVDKVIVLGGEASVSEDVVNQIKDLGIDVDRVAGKDRAATSVEALKYMAARYNRLNGIVVCTGNTFADALSIAPVAIREGYGVVFTQADGTLSEDAIKAIKDVKGRMDIVNPVTWDSKNLIVVGGEASVPNSVIGQLAQNGLHFRRIDGNNRYLTSVKIAEEFFGTYYDYSNGTWTYYGDGTATVEAKFVRNAFDKQELLDSDGITVLGTYYFLDGAVVADGENYPDALTAGPIAAMLDEPVVLVSDDSKAGIKFLKQTLGAYVDDQWYLGKNNNLIVGGEASVSKATKDKLEDIDDFYLEDLVDNVLWTI